MKTLHLPFVLKLALVLICIFGLGYLVKLGQTILAPMFFAFLMALLFLPFAHFLETKWRFSRTLSTFASVFIMALVLSLLIYFFSSQLSDFAQDFPTLEKQIARTFSDLQQWVARTFHLNVNKQMGYVNEGFNKVLASTGVILGFTLSMFSALLGFAAFSVLFFIFILNYRRQLYTFFIDIFDKRFTPKVLDVVSETQLIIKQYILGLLIQIVIMSALASILLSVLGVKYALLIGVLTGLLNVIPYIGIFASGLVAGLISFATGNPHTLWVFIGYIAIHAVDANVTLPLVVGSKVNINALFSFIALLVGEHLWGISGMFLSIPFLAILKIIFERSPDLQPWAALMGEQEDQEESRVAKNLRRRLWMRAAKKREEGNP